MTWQATLDERDLRDALTDTATVWRPGADPEGIDPLGGVFPTRVPVLETPCLLTAAYQLPFETGQPRTLARTPYFLFVRSGLDIRPVDQVTVASWPDMRLEVVGAERESGQQPGAQPPFRSEWTSPVTRVTCLEIF